MFPGGRTAGLWQWLLRFGRRNRLPLSEGNVVRPLVRGDLILEATRRLIDEATSTLYVEMYIWAADATGRDLLERLRAARARGVRVRCVVDHFGSWEMADRLEASGLTVRFYHPIGRRLPWRHWHRRNHRKLVIADGHRAVLGSANWAEAYDCSLNEACYRDLGLEVQGAAVTDLVSDFQRSWAQAGGRPFEDPAPADIPAQENGVGWIHPVSIQVLSSLNGGGRSLRRHLFLVLRQLRERALIANAYFVPDPQLLRLLQRTARRGVAVEVLVPGDTDHPFVQAASRATFGPLLRAGVRIRERQARMFHAKAALLDGDMVVIGSANLDSRSFRHNLELNLLLRSTGLVEAFQEAIAPDLAASTPWTLEAWEALPAWQKALQRFAYLFWWWL
jgi:cardiolipin synthase